MEHKVDEKIFKTIISSSQSAVESLDPASRKSLLNEDEEKEEKEENEDRSFVKTDLLFNALSISLTKLLSCTVSKEAYQRYSVRLHTIEMIREWCSVPVDLVKFHQFPCTEKRLEFLRRILDNYLTNDMLHNWSNSCMTSNSLIQLTYALIPLATKQSFYVRYIEKLLTHLAMEELSTHGKCLLNNVLKKRTNLKVSLEVIEELYRLQKCHLVEEPLINKFQTIYVDLKDNESHSLSHDSFLTDQLIELSAASAKIFYYTIVVLKDIVVQLKYAPVVLDFVQLILKHIKDQCRKIEKDIMQLYPTNLQSVIVLLEIDPCYHSEDSRNAVYCVLANILDENKDIAIILISHFPKWVKGFETYLTKDKTNFMKVITIE